ncbi:hypothetical protein AOR01nite_26530 [Acetobacter orleanensis]|uniref:Uncharacterized protein n=1 Tax=Acetobacter orleanensis TaxID=104099 RepID=A0A4Y3TPA4_9PROT|nr:hypothetical protein AOR01nite_26530 [Acetobacter orleanensis]
MGTNCTIAHNLKYFGLQEKSGLSDSFISSYFSILWLFENKFNIVSNSMDLYLKKIELAGSDTIVHVPSGLVMHHAFSRDENGFVVKHWRDEIKEVSKKYKYLGDRMRASILTAPNPIFYITHDVMSDSDKDRILTSWQAEISKRDDAILRIINQARIIFERNLKFVLVDVRENTREAVSSLQGVKVMGVHYHGDFHDGNPSHFGGCKKGWREVFEQVEQSVF